MRRTFQILLHTVCISLLMVTVFSTASARIYENKPQPKPFVIKGIVTVQFEDDIDVTKISRGFGKVRFGIASLDQLCDNWNVDNGRRIFGHVTEKPAFNSGRKDLTRFWELSFPEDIPVQDIIDALQQNPNIRMAEAVWAMPLAASPNDPLHANQWAMFPPGPDPQFYDAWDIETGSDSIKFALIDSGINYKHRDLEGNIWVNPGEDIDGDGVVYDLDDLNGIDDDGNGLTDDLIGFDFFTGLGQQGTYPGEDGGGIDTDPSDFGGHGTHVAGIVAAMTNNGLDVTGAAGGWYGGHRSFRGVQIICLRVGATAADGNGYVNSNNCGTAISYAVRMGANVINASWGTQNSSPMIAAMSEANAAGVTFTHAAGNDNANQPDFVDADPGGYEVLSVASTGAYSDVKSGFSNYGPWIDVCAPGASIVSTYSSQYNPTVANLSGTSMAAPMVAGLACLIRSAMPSLSKTQVDSIILATADDIYPVNNAYYAGQLGSGRINAFAALSGLPSAKFSADVTVGEAPLTVNFTDQSANTPILWDWKFGTGDVSADQNPSYTYTEAGVYDVSLVEWDGNPLGPGEEHLRDYIWVKADTLRIDTVKVLSGEQAVIPVYLANTVQIKDIIFAFTLNNPYGVTYDSFSVAGLRTESLASINEISYDAGNQRFTIAMVAHAGNETHYLTAGSGPILNLYLNVPGYVSQGTIAIDTIKASGNKPRMVTVMGEYFPVFSPGTLIVLRCAYGDVNCNGTVMDIVDLTALVDWQFGDGAYVDMVSGGDANQDGNVDILDLTFIVDYLFGG